MEAVCSARKESSDSFAVKFGFRKSLTLEEFKTNTTINTVLILGPNKVHFEHLKLALEMPSVTRIYLEKPVCSNLEEEMEMAQLAVNSGKQIQVGFQYLQTASVREALDFWRSGKLGNPIHFDLKILPWRLFAEIDIATNGKPRLTPAPDGGAMADLGSHGISLLMAFLGENLQITSAVQAGRFADVPEDSDLFSLLSLVQPESFAAGTMSASRISSGTGDLVSLEIYAEKRECCVIHRIRSIISNITSKKPDNGRGRLLVAIICQLPVSRRGMFLRVGLRSMIHAHYIFLGGNDPKAFMPDLKHGLAVQRIVRETAKYLKNYRDLIQDNGKK